MQFVDFKLISKINEVTNELRAGISLDFLSILGQKHRAPALIKSQIIIGISLARFLIFSISNLSPSLSLHR